MRAVILAAGRGKRLGPIGEERPKCLVKLAGRALIERQLAALRGGGINAIAIVRGYRAAMIDFPGVTYFENPRWADSNMVTSLSMAAPWLRSEPIIVSYGDIFYPRELVRRLVTSAGDLAISYDRTWRMLWSRRFEDPLADAETFRVDPDGSLMEIGGKTTDIREIQGQYMGLLKFTPRAWREVETLLETLDPRDRDRLDMTSLLRRLLSRQFPIAALSIHGQWGEVDSSNDLALYEKMIAAGELTLED